MPAIGPQWAQFRVQYTGHTRPVVSEALGLVALDAAAAAALQLANCTPPPHPLSLSICRVTCHLFCADMKPEKRLDCWNGMLIKMTLTFPRTNDSHRNARNYRIDSQTPENTSHFAMRITLFSSLPSIRPYRIPSCITHRPLPIYRISFKLK